MQMRKLLLQISYLGTHYQGLQLQSKRLVRAGTTKTIPEYSTVQGIVEQGLRTVLKWNEIITHVSSRTDAGVHAISSTLNFLIVQDAFEKFPFSPETICQSLNYYLEKNQTDIRIQKVVEVPESFTCRRAFSRTYNYRLGVAKTNDFDNCVSAQKLSPFLPITELHKAQVVSQPFDVEAVQQACRIFIGTWNFRNFATLTEPLGPEELTKSILKFSFSKSVIEEEDVDGVIGNSYYGDPVAKKLDFYDFHVEGSGFLRRQVRRMVGLLLGIGRGIVKPNDLLQMLKNPDAHPWPPSAYSASAEGLFLKSVNYKKEKSVEVIRGFLS